MAGSGDRTRTWIGSPARRRRAGRAMLVVAVLGLLSSVAGVIVGWRLVGQFERTIDDSLVLTSEALVTIDETIDLADAVITSVADTLTIVERAMGTSVDSFDGVDRLLGDLTELSDVAAPSLVDSASTVEELAATGEVIDTFLGGLAGLPLTPSYTGDLGTRLSELADDLAPLGEALGTVGEDLIELRGSTTSLQQDLGEVQRSIDQINEEVAGSQRLLDDYRAQTGEATVLAGQTQSDLDDDVALTRAFIVVAGLLFAAGQMVPAWMGFELLTTGRRDGF